MGCYQYDVHDVRTTTVRDITMMYRNGTWRICLNPTSLKRDLELRDYTEPSLQVGLALPSVAELDTSTFSVIVP